MATKETRILSSANEALNTGKFQEASELAQNHINNGLPDEKAARKIIDEANFKQAELQFEKEEYDESLSLLTTSGLLSNAADREYNQKALDLYSKIYEKKIQISFEEKNYDAIVELHKKKIKYEPWETYEQKRKILHSYFLISDEFRWNNSLFNAVQFLKNIPIDIREYDSEGTIKKEKLAILKILASDTGSEGQKLVNEIKDDICSGFAVDVDYMSITAQKGIAGKAIVCPQYLPINSKKLADKPSELKYFITKDETIRNLTTCEYENGYNLTPQQVIWKIQVKDIHTGKVINSRDFQGKTPSCPSSYKFTKGEFNENLKGEEPSSGTVISYLNSVIQ